MPLPALPATAVALLLLSSLALAVEEPQMVVVPAGTFMMGAPPDEPGQRKYENPQQRLSIASFAIGATEVTVDQYAAFVADTKRATPAGCYTHGDAADDISDLDPAASWRAPAFAQTGRHPVVCVSWQDVRDYANWLSRKTGQLYRLPSEAEWEYAARGGTTTAFFWGTNADRECRRMNGGDRALARAVLNWSASIERALQNGDQRARLVDCDDGSAFTAPVGSYEANPFGLRDIIGNAWEWVEDCATQAIPKEPHPPAPSTCEYRRTRGGSWDDFPEDLRSATRSRLPPDQRRNDLGFRVARSLPERAR